MQALKAILEYEQEHGDLEGCHQRADNVLCELLATLGYPDVVAAWEKVDKWYS